MTDISSLPHAAPGARIVTPEDLSVAELDALTGPRPQDVLFALPESGRLKLPTGLINRDGLLVTDAEVKELTGAEEEMLAKESRNRAVVTPAVFLDLILSASVVSIGNAKPDPADLRRLLVGDRHYLALAVRRLTYGDEWELDDFVCRLCGKSFGVAIDLRCPGDDIKMRELPDPAVQHIDVPIRRGTVRLRLVSGGDEIAVVGDGSRTMPEQKSALIDLCTLELNGQHPPIGFARSLGLKDRDAIMTALGDAAPGPLTGEVSVPCSECGKSSSYALSMADLFLR